MREQLKALEGVRGTFTGTVARFGTKKAYRGYPIPTIMLSEVRDAGGKIVTDHLWFKVGKQMEALELKTGEVVVFDARVTQYEAGYRGRREDVYDAPLRTDYRLSNPTKIHRQIVVEQLQLEVHG